MRASKGLFIILNFLAYSLALARLEHQESNEVTAQNLAQHRKNFQKSLCTPNFAWDAFFFVKRQDACSPPETLQKSRFYQSTQTSSARWPLSFCEAQYLGANKSVNFCFGAGTPDAFSVQFEANPKGQAAVNFRQNCDLTTPAQSLCSNSELKTINDTVLATLQHISRNEARATQLVPVERHSWTQDFTDSSLKNLARDLHTESDQQILSALQRLSAKTSVWNEIDTMSIWLSKVEERFKNMCVMDGGKITRNANLKSGLALLNIRDGSACFALLSFYRLGCYQSYLKKEVEEMNWSCAREAKLASLLHLDADAQHAKNILRHAQSLSILASTQSEPAKITALTALAKSYPNPLATIPDAALRFEAGHFYSALLYQRAKLENNPETRKELVLRALATARENPVPLGKGPHFVAFPTGREHVVNQIALENWAIELGLTKTSPHAHAQDESLIESLKRHDDEIERFHSEMDDLQMQVDANSEIPNGLDANAKVKDIVADNFAAPLDPVAELILKIRQNASQLIQEAEKRRVLKPANQNQWQQNEWAEFDINILRDHLLPKLEDLRIDTLRSVDNLLSKDNKNIWKLLGVLYTNAQLQKRPTISDRPGSDLLALQKLSEAHIFNSAETKTLLKKWVFDHSPETAFEGDQFFDAAAQNPLSRYFQYPPTSKFVRERARKAPTLDAIYRDWLSFNILDLEDKNLNALRSEKNKYSRHQADMHEALIRSYRAQRSTANIAQLEAIFPTTAKSPAEDLEQNADRHEKALGLSLIDKLASAQPLRRFVELDFQETRVDGLAGNYKDHFEKEVLLPALKTDRDAGVFERIGARLEKEGYGDLPVDYVFAHLNSGGTNLMRLQHQYFEEQLLQQLSRLKTSLNTQKFEERSERKIYFDIFDRNLRPTLNQISLEQLKKLLALSTGNDIDLPSLIQTINPDKAWKNEILYFGSAEQLVWDRTLYFANQANKDELIKRTQLHLNISDKINFQEDSFREFLNRQLALVDFSDLELNFIYPRLGQNETNLAALRQEQSRLAEEERVKQQKAAAAAAAAAQRVEAERQKVADERTQAENEKQEKNRQKADALAATDQAKKALAVADKNNSHQTNHSGNDNNGTGLGGENGAHKGSGSTVGTGAGLGVNGNADGDLLKSKQPAGSTAAKDDTDSKAKKQTPPRTLYFYKSATPVIRMLSDHFMTSEAADKVQIEEFTDVENTVAPTTPAFGEGPNTFTLFPPNGPLNKTTQLIRPTEGFHAENSQVPLLSSAQETLTTKEKAGNEYSLLHSTTDDSDRILDHTIDAKTDLKKYRQYYLKGGYQGPLLLPPDMTKFIRSLKSFYNEYKTALAKHQDQELGEIEERWIGWLVQSIGKNDEVPDVEQYLRATIFNPALRTYQSPQRSELLLAASLEKYISLHFFYQKLGTPVNPMKLDAYNKRPNAGKNLQQSLDTLRGNCATINSLYQNLMQRYFEFPCRAAGGFAGNAHKNTKFQYSKDYAEDYNVIIPEKDGHAWSEVFIGNSWVTMDATPVQELIAKGMAGGGAGSAGAAGGGQNGGAAAAGGPTHASNEKTSGQGIASRALDSLKNGFTSGKSWVDGWWDKDNNAKPVESDLNKDKELAIKLEETKKKQNKVDLALQILGYCKAEYSSFDQRQCFEKLAALQLSTTELTQVLNKSPKSGNNYYKDFSRDDLPLLIPADVSPSSLHNLNAKEPIAGKVKDGQMTSSSSSSIYKSNSSSLDKTLKNHYRELNKQTFYIYGPAGLKVPDKEFPKWTHIIWEDNWEQTAWARPEALVNAATEQLQKTLLDKKTDVTALLKDLKKYPFLMKTYFNQYGRQGLPEKLSLAQLTDLLSTDDGKDLTTNFLLKILKPDLVKAIQSSRPWSANKQLHSILSADTADTKDLRRALFDVNATKPEGFWRIDNENDKQTFLNLPDLPQHRIFSSLVDGIERQTPRQRSLAETDFETDRRRSNIYDTSDRSSEWDQNRVEYVAKINSSLIDLNRRYPIIGTIQNAANHQAFYDALEQKSFKELSEYTNRLSSDSYSKQLAIPVIPTQLEEQSSATNIRSYSSNSTKFLNRLDKQLRERYEHADTDPLLNTLKTRQESFFQNGDVLAGQPIQSYATGHRIPELLGDRQILDQEKSSLNNEQECLHAAYFLMDADQLLRDSTPSRMKEGLQRLLEKYPHLTNTDYFIRTALGSLSSAAADVVNSSGSVKDNLEALSPELLANYFRKIFENTAHDFTLKCQQNLSNFFVKNPSKPYRKNWIQLQKIMVQDRFRHASLVGLPELIRLTNQAKGLNRNSPEERAVTPHLLDIATVPIGIFAKSNPSGVEAFSRAQAENLKQSDLKDAELSFEFKRFSLTAMTQFNGNTAEALLGIIEAFFSKMSTSAKESSLDWLLKMRDELGNNSKKPQSQEFINHMLARFGYQPGQSALTTNYAAALGEILTKVRPLEQRYALRSYLKAAQTSIRVHLDSPLPKLYFDSVTQLNPAQLAPLISSEEKNLMRNYLEAYMRELAVDHADDLNVTLIKGPKRELYLPNNFKDSLAQANLFLKQLNIPALTIQDRDGDR